jgi:hypothetical protein
MPSRSHKTVSVTDARDAQRVSFYCPVSYTSEEEALPSEKKGQLLNLSKKGCRILGPVLGKGCTTTITIDLNDKKPPLSIVGASVSWNDGFSFGVKFPTMSVEDRHRLQELVLKLVTVRETTQDRAAFRLA